MRLEEIDEADGSMLEALEEAAVEKAKAESWTLLHSQQAVTQELLYAVYHALHVGLLKPPHPEPGYEAWRPEWVKAAAAKAAAKPLTGRQFVARLLGGR